MPLTVAPETDLDALAVLISHPSLIAEFELWQGRVASAFEDPFHPRELTWVAREDGVPVGFALAYVLPSTRECFAMIRIGVLESHRRRGIGTQLLGLALPAVRAFAPDCREASINAWVPNEAASGFAARHGFAHARYFWLMERPRGAAPEVELPAGVELKLYDGSEEALRDWNQVYNASFAKHYHFVRSSIDDARQLASRAEFRRDGLALAYREGRCVGFCRNELMEHRGEIGVLGTAPEARRIGLGRALLRWGVGWLEAQNAPQVTLLVDGENEDALALYRSEGFAVTKTREVWSQTS